MALPSWRQRRCGVHTYGRSAHVVTHLRGEVCHVEGDQRPVMQRVQKPHAPRHLTAPTIPSALCRAARHDGGAAPRLIGIDTTYQSRCTLDAQKTRSWPDTLTVLHHARFAAHLGRVCAGRDDDVARRHNHCVAIHEHQSDRLVQVHDHTGACSHVAISHPPPVNKTGSDGHQQL